MWNLEPNQTLYIPYGLQFNQWYKVFLSAFRHSSIIQIQYLDCGSHNMPVPILKVNDALYINHTYYINVFA